VKKKKMKIQREMIGANCRKKLIKSQIQRKNENLMAILLMKTIL
jgi:hypothetical protein